MPGVRELVFHKFYDNLISKWEKRYLKNLCLLTNSLSLRPLTFSLLKRICQWSDTAATNFPCVFPPARPVLSCTHVKYKRLLRRLLTHLIYVAECNLGKVKLETMLASCLSLEFTRGRQPWAFRLGIWDFNAIVLRSSHFARVVLRENVRLCLFQLSSQPSLW